MSETGRGWQGTDCVQPPWELMGVGIWYEWRAAGETWSHSGWVVEHRFQFRHLKLRVWLLIKVGQHHVIGLDLPRAPRPSKTGTGGQSSWGLRSLGGWGEGTFLAVLMGWTAIITCGFVCKARRINAPSCGLSSSLGLWNPFKLFPKNPPRKQLPPNKDGRTSFS